ncbi:hypothetical protein JTE90_014337 [Oedothorax gibbosus]|uniref:Uncharacterized protein n=1 Tax=Oedothorax gibbosus TaxID=931172 RepID=A0AAV6TSG9_9ARAC|nr:hypothetical protein JTE90_014337 [Oedothorax gibbosus]
MLGTWIITIARGFSVFEDLEKQRKADFGVFCDKVDEVRNNEYIAVKGTLSSYNDRLGDQWKVIEKVSAEVTNVKEVVMEALDGFQKDIANIAAASAGPSVLEPLHMQITPVRLPWTDEDWGGVPWTSRHRLLELFLLDFAGNALTMDIPQGAAPFRIQDAVSAEGVLMQIKLNHVN